MKIKELINRLITIEEEYPNVDVSVVVKGSGIPFTIPVEYVGIAENKNETFYKYMVTLHVTRRLR